MTTQLNYIVAQQRIADLQHTAQRARLAHEVVTGQARSRNASSIARMITRLARLSQQRTPQQA